MRHYVYIIESLEDGTFYIGTTRELNSRLERHNQGRSRYTKKNVLGSWFIMRSIRTDQVQ